MPPVNLLTAVKVEEDEIKRREKNIVVFGVKTSCNLDASERAKEDDGEVQKS